MYFVLDRRKERTRVAGSRQREIAQGQCRQSEEWQTTVATHHWKKVLDWMMLFISATILHWLFLLTSNVYSFISLDSRFSGNETL